MGGAVPAVCSAIGGGIGAVLAAAISVGIGADGEDPVAAWTRAEILSAAARTESAAVAAWARAEVLAAAARMESAAVAALAYAEVLAAAARMESVAIAHAGTPFLAPAAGLGVLELAAGKFPSFDPLVIQHPISRYFKAR